MKSILRFWFELIENIIMKKNLFFSFSSSNLIPALKLYGFIFRFYKMFLYLLQICLCNLLLERKIIRHCLRWIKRRVSNFMKKFINSINKFFWLNKFGNKFSFLRLALNFSFRLICFHCWTYSNWFFFRFRRLYKRSFFAWKFFFYFF